MQSTRSAPSAAPIASSSAVSGFRATPTPSPRARAWAIAPSRSSTASTWNVTLSPPARRERLEVPLRPLDHQVAVERRSPRMDERSDRGDHDRADRDLGDEVGVSGVEVDDLRARLDQHSELLAEAREVGGVDRRLDLHLACPLAPAHVPTLTTWGNPWFPHEPPPSCAPLRGRCDTPPGRRSRPPARQLRRFRLVTAGESKVALAWVQISSARSGSRPRLRQRSSRTAWRSASAPGRRRRSSWSRSARGGSTSAASRPRPRRRRPRARWVSPSSRSPDADALARLDLAVDGADQVTRDRWLVKGGGGAHTREKIVARAAERFVVIVSSDKLVEAIRPPIPLELLEYGLAATLAALGDVELRDAPRTPDDGVIADWIGTLESPAALSRASRRDAGSRRARAVPARARLPGPRRARRRRRADLGSASNLGF